MFVVSLPLADAGQKEMQRISKNVDSVPYLYMRELSNCVLNYVQ